MRRSYLCILRIHRGRRGTAPRKVRHEKTDWADLRRNHFAALAVEKPDLPVAFETCQAFGKLAEFLVNRRHCKYPLFIEKSRIQKPL